jgi:hypothetical protein
MGRRVRVVFEEHGDGDVWIPLFEPLKTGKAS